MLGSQHEAEDMVQEAWLRWHRTDRDEVLEPAAWLTRVVSRLCLDQMKSARARRETYPGTWLPETLIEVEDDTLREDNLTLMLMMALERLSPLGLPVARCPRPFNVIWGADQVGRMFLGLARKFSPIELESFVTIDGLPGFVARVIVRKPAIRACCRVSGQEHKAVA